MLTDNRAATLAMANHIFSMSYDMYLTHAGLLLGWNRGDRLSAEQIKAVESCRYVLSHDDDWQRPDTRG